MLARALPFLNIDQTFIPELLPPDISIFK